MAKSVNKVILIGNLGKDPEMKYTPGGMPVARLTLATNERFKDKEGNWQDRTEWHNLVAFQRTAEIAGEYLKKGRTVYIEGSLRTNSWDDKESGQKKYRTEIIVNDLVLLGGGREAGEGGGGGGSFSRGAGEGASFSRGGSKSNNFDQRVPENESIPSSGGGAPDITDEDIPF
jgi:single-strand DNA-binding protein